MAMRTASPWWASLAFGIGLLLTFLSERILDHQPGLRLALTSLGVGIIVAVTAARAWTTFSTKGTHRQVERTLLICHLGTLLALVLYALSTKWGMGVVGVSEKSARYSSAMTVLWSILMLTSLAPVLMVELSLGTALRTNFDVDDKGDEASVEYYRVREIGWSGLTVAFAAALLMVTCGVAKERNVSRDVSYFKTSSPGESTRNIVRASKEPVRVHLFFPEANEVKEQVTDYFEALASATGKVEVTHHDRYGDAELAGKFKVQKDGIIVLASGTGENEKFFPIDVDTDIEKARRATGKLRNLDREVNTQLMKLVRDKRKVYFLKGHGEVTDPSSIPEHLKGRVPERGTTLLRRVITQLNYEVKDLTPMQLVDDVPDDATIVIVMGPAQALDAAEWASLDRYLTRGGRLMVALDPVPPGTQSMGVLEGRLGVRMIEGGMLMDDKEFLPQRGSITDHRFVLTSNFTAHATTTAVSRGGLFLMIEPGALEEIPFTTKTDVPKKTITIRSMDSAWLDFNQDFAATSGGPRPEKRQRWTVGAAIEGPKVGDKDGFRALVYADADLFVDLQMIGGGRASVRLPTGNLLVDSIRWLGGEEVFSGEIVSEEDKPIQHTKNQDAVWFTLTTVGAPLLVLTLGLVGTWLRRRRTKKVTP